MEHARSLSGRSHGAVIAIVTLAVVAALAAVPVSTRADAPAAVPGAATVAEPSGYRMEAYRAPVPAGLTGATTVATAEAAQALMVSGAVFVDVYPRAPKPPGLAAGTVWREPVHTSIAGAHWLPNVGYGVLSPEMERAFADALSRLTDGDRSRPVVLFCERNCWMSWNAAKRAVSYGYTAIHWYPDGSDGWAEALLPTAQLMPTAASVPAASSVPLQRRDP